MREELSLPFTSSLNSRITPAHAGKIAFAGLSALLGGDHPRACGKNSFLFIILPLFRGSPPRMREEFNSAVDNIIQARITPAHAGRIVAGKLTVSAMPGSPPRMREESILADKIHSGARITPAHAGRMVHNIHRVSPD